MSNGWIGKFAGSLIEGAFGGITGALVDIGVDFLVDQLDQLIRKDEIAIQKAQQLQQEYQQTQVAYQQNITTLESLGEEFAVLSAGVDIYGNNISLTADQYERYKEIVQQVAAISPELVVGYDAENQAIVNKNQLLERSIELQKEQAKAELEKKTSKIFDALLMM